MEEGRTETWRCFFTRPLRLDTMSRVILDPALNLSPAGEGLWEDCRLEAPHCPNTASTLSRVASDGLLPESSACLQRELLPWVALPHSPYGDRNFSEKSRWLQGTSGVWRHCGLGKSWPSVSVTARLGDQATEISLTLHQGCPFLRSEGSSVRCFFVGLINKKRHT